MIYSKCYDTVTGYIFSPDHKKILLVKKRFSGKIMAPGGHVENEETYIEALLREMREETGLGSDRLKRIRITDRLLTSGEDFKVIEAQQDEDFIVIEQISRLVYYYDHIYCFVIDDEHLTHIKSTEVSKVFWQNVSDIHSLNMYSNIKQTIAFYYSYLIKSSSLQNNSVKEGKNGQD